MPSDIPELDMAAWIQLDNDDNDDDRVEDSQDVESHIELSKKSCKCLHYY